jgi:predicted RecB family nuclease
MPLDPEDVVDPLRYRRLDVSAVPRQGGYIAKQCPVVAHLRFDPTNNAEPNPYPEALERRFEAGRLFETEIFTELSALHPEAVVLDAHERNLISQTVAAMKDGAPLILGGQLPHDEIGRRVGKPDVLVRVASSSEGAWSYLPIDVKNHATLQSSAPGAFGPAVHSSFGDTVPTNAETLESKWSRRRADDVLQLSHYWRMLEAAGLAPPGDRIAGIIGTERGVTWFDLDTPVWRSGGATRSSLERYDFEFSFRLDVIARAMEQGRPGAEPPIVVPLSKRECGECEWNERCVPELEASDHVTLVPNVGYSQWLVHRDHGVTTRSELATLDARTASLLDDGVDITRWRDEAAGLASDTPLTELRIRAPKQRERLLARDVRTAGDLLSLDATTSGYSGASLSNLTSSIDLARLGLLNVVARARGVNEIVVPRADVEIDIDLESSGERVYLWGTFVSGALPRVEAGYRPFTTFDALDDEREAELFADFWEWLRDARLVAEKAELSLLAYCHSGPSAENRQLRAAARRFAGRPRIPAVDEIDEFIAGGQWIDMRDVIATQTLTPFGTGLKALAAYADFAWRDEDPGGEQSMVWYELAVAHPDEDVRAENQRRVLEYNDDDCRATLHLRDWLEREGPSLPSLEELDHSFSAT